MSTTSKKGKVNASRIESAISSSMADRADQSTLSGMARILAQMGIDVAIQSEPAPISEDGLLATKSIPRVSKFEMDFLAIVTNPNKWYLVATTSKKRRSSAFSQYGKCFETTIRQERGHYNHYVRYNGSELNDSGQRRINEINTKLELIREAVASGGVRPMTKFSSGTGLGSLTHAVKYPLNNEERNFLRLFDSPNEFVVLSEAMRQPSDWHAFRWKWQTRYGFDLSQISFTQKKRDDGLFTVRGKYTTNSEGGMNKGLAEFVEFLRKKPTSKATI